MIPTINGRLHQWRRDDIITLPLSHLPLVMRFIGSSRCCSTNGGLSIPNIGQHRGEGLPLLLGLRRRHACLASLPLVGFSCGNDREKSGDIVRTCTTDRAYTMASRASKIAAVAREIFGTLPIRGVRTGMQYLKTPLTGAYESRFYMEPIEPIARKVRSKNSLPYLVC